MTRRRQPSLLAPLASITACALLACGLGGCQKGEQPNETQGQTTSTAPAPGPATTPTPGTPTPSAPTPGTPPASAPGTAPEPPIQAAKPLDPAQLPAVVARVNGQEIKKDELITRVQEMRVELARTQGVKVSPSSAFYQEILEGMIAHHLLLQEAKSLGITITDAEADQMMEGFKSRFPSQEVFQKQLAANKMTEAQLRQKMRDDDDTKVNKLIQTRIAPAVQVTEAEAQAFYQQNQQRMKTSPQLHLRHILIAVAPQASEADRQAARQKAESLLQQIKNGADFAQLATQNSNDPGSAAQGGDLVIRPGQTVPSFEKAAFALKKPKDLSPIVQTPYGYHIIQLVERQEPQVVPFDKAKGRIGLMLRDEKIKQALHAHVEELKTKGKVETYI